MTFSTNAAAPPDLTAALWRAYQQGLGTADAAVHLDYLLTLLVLKCLDPEPLPAPGGEATPGLLAHLVVPEAAQLATLLARRLEPQLGGRLDAALAALTEANPDVLADAFAHVVFSSPPSGSAVAWDRYLQQQLACVAALPVAAARQTDPHAPGHAAAALLARVARQAGKKGSAWCTPPEVADLLARLLAPHAGERLSDPHCGSGALLGALAAQVDPQQVSWSGQEPDPVAYGRCRLRLLLQGVTQAQLARGEALRHPLLRAGGALQLVDVVATQPPLSTGAWGHELAAQDPHHRFWRGVPPATQGDFAYISHVLATLNGRTGRAGLLVGHGALYRTGHDGRIRQQLLEENVLDAVIGLPAQVLPGLNSPVALLLFRQGRTRHEVLFMDASALPELPSPTSPLSADARARLVQTYQHYVSVAPYARCVPLSELDQNDYNLNLARYVPTSPAEPVGDWRRSQAEIGRLEGELQRAEAALQSCLHALGIADEA